MSNIALIFPGQGSQAIGMGKDFYENSNKAKEIFNQADEILGKKLSQICFNGPEEDLKRTVNTQPAIFTVSVIAYELFKVSLPVEIKYTAGHSLGEYSALYASGAYDLETGLNLVKKRSELMDKAPSGSMAAIVGLNYQRLEEIISEVSSKGIITIANYNTQDQLVISGESAAVESACTLAKESGAKRALMLPVSGAFHSPLMKNAADEFAKEVAKYKFNTTSLPVVTNVDALPTTEGFNDKLVKQIYASVLWSQSVQLMKDNGVSTFIEIGPGKVLSGLVKKIDRSITVLNIDNMSSLESTVNAVKGLVKV